MEIQAWMTEYTSAVRAAFGDRIVLIGLQGSRARGEAHADSDVDAVLVLDRLDYADLLAYRAAVAPLPERALLCGFVSGRAELAAWSRQDRVQFYYDTTVLEGSLDGIFPAPDRADARAAALEGACAVYHACVHGAVHDRSPEGLRALYKSALFVLRADHFAGTGQWLRTAAELRANLQGEPLALLRLAGEAESCTAAEYDRYAAVLLDWAGNLIRLHGGGAGQGA